MSDDAERPFRAMVREWAKCEDNQTTKESGIALCAVIEAMDAQTEAIKELTGNLSDCFHDLGKAVGA
jgi:hypothetical protein